MSNVTKQVSEVVVVVTPSWTSYLTAAGSPINHSFVCPITQQIMNDPVTIQDGHTFERAAIEEWLAKHNTSPIGRELIVDKRVYSNTNVKILIQEFMKNNPNSVKKDSELDQLLEARITSKATQRQPSSRSFNVPTTSYVTIPGWNTIQRALSASTSSSRNNTPRIAVL